MTAFDIGTVILDESNGSRTAVNDAEKRTTGRVPVFLDARQFVEPNAILRHASSFAGPSVGVVGGEAVLHTPADVMEVAPWGQALDTIYLSSPTWASGSCASSR
jgi:hypothetical protein